MIKHQRIVNGYDLEELYFERLNRELIQNLKGTGSPSDAEGTHPSKPPGAQVIQFPTRQTETKKKAA